MIPLRFISFHKYLWIGKWDNVHTKPFDESTCQFVSPMINQHATMMVFRDFSKALDTMDHHILLRSLNRQGIAGKLFKIFISMFSKLRSAGLNHNLQKIVIFSAACSHMILLNLSKFQPIRNRQKFVSKSTCFNMKKIHVLVNYQTIHKILFWVTTLTENKFNI